MPMSETLSLAPISNLDKPFLSRIYASTRSSEMAVVMWSEKQKQVFLQTQFEAQNQHYRARYPDAAFNLIKINDQPVGRLYLAELTDQIRIIDLTFLPEFFDKDIFIQLVKEILLKGEKIGKPVRIYLENFNPEVEIFTELGFYKIDEYGIYFLWEHQSTV